ncbi:hypothetical protein SK128_027616 [Halocaridina rubra]|uniref:Homeodomain-like domain-containing protein n=1 Tax=Halocaridina rubra TaxID=373956 RepID=A0AAN8WLT8_HALRR
MLQSASYSPGVLNARALLVKLWFQGLPVKRIAQVTGVSRNTVYRWVRRWTREGHVFNRPREGRIRTRMAGKNDAQLDESTDVSSSTNTPEIYSQDCVITSNVGMMTPFQ